MPVLEATTITKAQKAQFEEQGFLCAGGGHSPGASGDDAGGMRASHGADR